MREVGVSNDEQTSTTVFDVLILTDNSSTPSMPESASEVLLCQIQVPMLIYRVQVPMLILPHLVTYLKEDTYSVHRSQIHGTLLFGSCKLLSVVD